MSAIRLALSSVVLFLSTAACADENPSGKVSPKWNYDASHFRPFWTGDIVDGESVLFLRDESTGEASATLMFPVDTVTSVMRAVDWQTGKATSFQEGTDFVVTKGSREIRLPKGSRIPSWTADDLRREPGTQKYPLTRRDGQGEILFGATDEYHQMQVCVTYRHAEETWPGRVPTFNEQALPRTIRRLRTGEPLSIVLLGDSISTGCNASGWAGSSPFQPPYQDLLLQHLQETYSQNITLTNLAVGGTSTPWGIEHVPDVVAAKPNLVLLAFGMNDSAGRPAAEFKANIAKMMALIRESCPETEFILVATMRGNSDWVTLQQELFGQYRDGLYELSGPGVAVADLTSMWDEMLKRKKDCDLTGNGVNHPNDFSHRVYAQVLSSLLIPTQGAPVPPFEVRLWPDNGAPVDATTFETSPAKITVHRPANSNGSAIVICPGGGYGGLVTGPEGHGIAQWLNQHGITGIVLEYRLPAGRSFVPLSDAQRAIRIARANARAWNLNPAHIGIMGFSAGGHLASTAATHFDSGHPEHADEIQRVSCRPDFAILVYPVVTMGDSTHSGSRQNLLGPNPTPEMRDLFSAEKQITEKTPPMYLTHAVDDQPVPCSNSRVLHEALKAAKIETRYLELPSGGHGLNGYKGPMWDAWQTGSLQWLAELGFTSGREQQK